MGLYLGPWLQGSQGWSTETKDVYYKAGGRKQRFTGAKPESTLEEKQGKVSKLFTVSRAPGEGQSKSNL